MRLKVPQAPYGHKITVLSMRSRLTVMRSCSVLSMGLV